MQLFAFGFGYVARHLAGALDSDWQAVGTVRTPERQAELKQHGYHAFCYGNGLDFPEGAKMALASSSHILVSIPPDDNGEDAALHAMRTMPSNGQAEWIGYLSTTGVYGDAQGGWVDETTPPNPTGGNAARRLQAERNWLAFGRESGIPVHIFRLSGIYGPGRNQLLAMKAGTARRISKPGHYFSRVHAADIAQVLQTSMHQPQDGSIYNVADDLPCESREVVEYAAQIMGLEPPPLVPIAEADLPPLAQQFYAANKRVRNERIKRELGITLHYPTFREGLDALWQEMSE